MIQAKIIKCVNFEIDKSSIDLNELMSDLVYSPSSRFAVNITNYELKIDSMVVLDPLNMHFHKYRNCSEQELQVELFYWYSEDCLVFIHADQKILYQTPVLLNHQQKTYEARRAVSYVTPSLICFDNTVKEAQSIEFVSGKFVLITCKPDLFHLTYAISHKPDASIPLKKFIFYNRISLNGLDSKIARQIQEERGDITVRFFLSSQISIIDNRVFFPILFNCETVITAPGQKDVSVLLGHYLVADLYEMPELPSNITLHDINAISRYLSLAKRKGHVSILECDRSNQTHHYYVRRLGRYGIVNDSLVFVSEETRSEDEVTTVSYIDFYKQTTTTIHEEVNAKDSDLAVSFTPFNMIIAKKISPTQISCSTVQYPVDTEQVSSLQKIALSKIFLNLDGKQKFAHTFSI